MNKPLVIKLKELKNSIMASVKSANRDGIPCYLVEPIIAEIHRQVSDAAQTEYVRAQADYEKAQKQPAEAEAQTPNAEQEKKGADPK